MMNLNYLASSSCSVRVGVEGSSQAGGLGEASLEGRQGVTSMGWEKSGAVRTTHAEGPAEGPRLGHWTQATLDGVQAWGGAAQRLGLGPAPGKKLAALHLSGVPALTTQLSYSRDAQLSARPERGQDPS